MAEHPKVFISYSHDSPEHKQWVLELGTKLVQNGVDVVLDRWDLTPGDNFTQFMEVGVRDRDWVLVICTDNYVKKANNREGGVGYEAQIVTAQLVENLGIDKFIPIIRHASGQEKMPTFLGGRVYIDFTDDSQFNEKFDDLLHKLYEVPVVEKPPLGEKPSFIKQEVSPVEGLDTQLPEIPEQVESVSAAYAAAVEIVRAEDDFGWKQLLKRIKPSVFNPLAQWRQNISDGQRLEGKEQLVQAVDTAVEIISPLISVALVGVESGKGQFRDQKPILDDLLNIGSWNRSVYVDWTSISFALGYVYHSLHGSLSLNTNQLDLALSLARAKIPVTDGRKSLPVWKTSQLRGYSQLFSGTRGGNCLESWKYLTKAYKKWEWLTLIFGNESEYQTSLIAYYMALNIHELATLIASGQQDTLYTSSEHYFLIPLTFLYEDYDITQRATFLLRHNPEALNELWASLNVTRQQMEYSWGNWIRLSEKELLGYGFNPIANQNLSDIFRYFFEGL